MNLNKARINIQEYFKFLSPKAKTAFQKYSEYLSRKRAKEIGEKFLKRMEIIDDIDFLDIQMKADLVSRINKYGIKYEEMLYNEHQILMRNVHKMIAPIILIIHFELLLLISLLLWEILALKTNILYLLIHSIIFLIASAFLDIACIIFTMLINIPEAIKTYKRNVLTRLIIYIARIIYYACDDWNNIDNKKKIIETLESISNDINKNLFAILCPRDLVIAKWFKDMLKDVSTAIMDKERWVLMPRKTTKDDFVRSMTHTLICITDGNWDDLERKETPELTRPQLVHRAARFLWKSTKTILVASLPILGFLGLQRTPLAPVEPFRDYIIIGLLLWAGITFLTLDSGFGTKLSALKDVKNLLLLNEK